MVFGHPDISGKSYKIGGPMLPVKITEIHDIIGRLKHGEEVDRDSVRHLVAEILHDRRNYGTWIKREKSRTENYVSVVSIGENVFGHKRVTGYRLERKAYRGIRGEG